MGSGHVMRCLTLAQLLRRRDAEVQFISRPLPGHLCDYVERQCFPVRRLSKPSVARVASDDPSAWLGATVAEDASETQHALAAIGRPADWLVVDNYALDASWGQPLRDQARHIMVIDDLANRRHDCDLLLDQNYYHDLEHRYDGLVPQHCEKLLGPRYALLREEFVQARLHATPRDGRVGRLLVFLGGADPENHTAKVLQAILQVGTPGLQVDVVVGASNPNQDSVRALCDSLGNARFHQQVNNMAELMLAADLAIGAGGATTWERCLLGLPSLTLVVAENQRRTTEDLSGLGLVHYLGDARDLNADDIAKALREALTTPAHLREMSDRAMRFMADAGAPALKAMTDKFFTAALA
jgi:UDP-2,4-diacetamido-2,4,6-trideoxy-beta-L-altropyranose hydrolase